MKLDRELLDKLTRVTFIYLIRQVTERKSVKISVWEKYGLSCNPAHFMMYLPDTQYRNIFIPKNVDPRLIHSIKAHWLVVWYLENHPEIDYKNDQSGKIKYFDVLDLAEKESGIFVHSQG